MSLNLQNRFFCVEINNLVKFIGFFRSIIDISIVFITTSRWFGVRNSLYLFLDFQLNYTKIYEKTTRSTSSK
jgi:hypothetical protein